MEPSARNRIRGKVAGIRKGQATGHVRGGDDAIAVIKASDVVAAS
jgi:molybdopterin-binding protein